MIHSKEKKPINQLEKEKADSSKKDEKQPMDKKKSVTQKILNFLKSEGPPKAEAEQKLPL